MKAFLERPIMQHQLDAVYCNVCGKAVTKNAIGYLEDHISLTKSWGFHSPYDGEAHAIDLCIECYNDWTSRFEIPPQVEYQAVI